MDDVITGNLQMWNLIIGFLLPIVVAFLTQRHWSSAAKSIVMFLSSIVAAVVTVYIQGDFTGKRFIDSALLIMVTAIGTYHGFWKPTEVAPTIEKATTFTGPNNGP